MAAIGDREAQYLSSFYDIENTDGFDGKTGKVVSPSVHRSSLSQSIMG